MGHHIDDQGRFQSDKYPDLAPDKIVLSFKDLDARTALLLYASTTSDQELANDIVTRVDSIELGEAGVAPVHTFTKKEAIENGVDLTTVDESVADEIRSIDRSFKRST